MLLWEESVRKSLAQAAVLEETRERLLRMTAEDSARWGSMTATQMVRHLSCACEAARGERNLGPVKMPVPPGVMKFLALYSGVRWSKNIQTTEELKLEIANTSEGDFNALLREAVERTESLARAAQCAPTHPFFGPMTMADWMRWGYLHADHHLRQFGR